MKLKDALKQNAHISPVFSNITTPLATPLYPHLNSFGPFPFKESNFLVVCNRNLFNNFIFQSLLGFFCDFFYFWPLSLVIFISYSLMEYEYVFTSHILIFLWFTVALQFIKIYNAPYLLLQIWIIRSLSLISCSDLRLQV